MNKINTAEFCADDQCVKVFGKTAEIVNTIVVIATISIAAVEISKALNS